MVPRMKPITKTMIAYSPPDLVARNRERLWAAYYNQLLIVGYRSYGEIEPKRPEENRRGYERGRHLAALGPLSPV